VGACIPAASATARVVKASRPPSFNNCKATSMLRVRTSSREARASSPETCFIFFISSILTSFCSQRSQPFRFDEIACQSSYDNGSKMSLSETSVPLSRGNAGSVRPRRQCRARECSNTDRPQAVFPSDRSLLSMISLITSIDNDDNSMLPFPR
jgi:hypothetical protein